MLHFEGNKYLLDICKEHALTWDIITPLLVLLQKTNSRHLYIRTMLEKKKLRQA